METPAREQDTNPSPPGAGNQYLGAVPGYGNKNHGGAEVVLRGLKGQLEGNLWCGNR